MRPYPRDACDRHECPDGAYRWHSIGPVEAEARQGIDERNVSIVFWPEDADDHEWAHHLLEIATELLDEHDANAWGRRYLYTAGEPGSLGAPLLVDMGGTHPTEDTDIVALVAPRFPGDTDAGDVDARIPDAEDSVARDNTHTVALYEWPIHIHQTHDEDGGGGS